MRMHDFFSVWLSKLLAGGDPLSVGVWQVLVAFPFPRAMAENVEQRFCIKFCQILGDTQAQTVRKIRQAFGNNAMGRTQIYNRFKRLKHGRTSSDSDKRTGRPSTSRNPLIIEQVRKLIRAERRMTVWEIAIILDISHGYINSTLTEDLGTHRVAAQFVPRLLPHEQQEVRFDVAQDMLDCANGDPDFQKIVITGDSLLPRPCSLWFLALLKDQNSAERDQIWHSRGHNDKCDGTASGHTKGGVPDMFPEMVGPLGYVCEVPRGILWRWLKLKLKMIATFFFLANVRILFGQPS